MTTLSSRQKQLLFDYSLGLTSQHEAMDAEGLLSANPEAVELYRSFQSTLALLESLELEPCPDDLAERLFARMRETRPAGPELDRLLAAERSNVTRIRIPLWRNWGEVVAAAAAVVLFVSILIPSVGYMRQRYGQMRCATQFAGIYGGYQNYMADHDGLLPAVTISPGAPWWKVGYQGKENYSNTRQPWLLVQQKYVEPDQFLCPGRRDEHRVSFDGIDLQSFNDFPSSAYIHVSVRIACPTSSGRDMMQKMVLLADRNPLSERLPSDYNASPRIELCETLMKANSRNHGNRGQNVLLYDGSVTFHRQRYTTISDDDIYTVRDMSCGTELRGCEVPASDADIFLAP